MEAAMSDRTAIGSLLTLDEVRQRLAALRAELERLEHDQAVFARAFHTHVAETVYATLIEEEARLAALPTLDLTLGDAPGFTLTSTEFGVATYWPSGTSSRREILDV
jgi:hypothetical protein